MISGYFRFIPVLCFLVVFASVFSGAGYAQEKENAGTLKEVMRAADSVTLMNNNRQTIRLWGIEAVPQADAVFYLNSRTALSNTIGNTAVECEIKGGNEAQCFSANNLDLALFMVQQGFATVDRADVFGTVFEEAYIKAEIAAQDSGKGIWSSGGNTDAGQGQSEGQASLFAILSFVMFLLIAATFTALSIIIMRGFKAVIQAQNDNLEMMGRERHLKNMERGIVATMLDSEMKANKSKIEAFIVVYEEMLRSLRDTSKEAKYKSSGDIVQKQPVLSRSVFDRNTDKLDVLGGKLSSDLIHFYARIKTNPEYVNIEPEMSLAQAVEVVQASVLRAKKLNDLIETLLEGFEKSGVMNEIPQE